MTNDHTPTGSTALDRPSRHPSPVLAFCGVLTLVVAAVGIVFG